MKPEDLGIVSERATTTDIGKTSKSIDEIIEEEEPSPPEQKLDCQWVERERVLPNDWNPNEMSEQDKKQLILSILDNGWTQPIVASSDSDLIIDGEHRWQVADSDYIAEREDLTPKGVPAGHIPVYFIDAGRKHSMIGTFQQNYAVGSHDSEKLTDLVESIDRENHTFAAGRFGIDEPELEMLLPDSEVSDATAELWDREPTRDIEEESTITDRIVFEYSEDTFSEIETVLSRAKFDMNLIKLCTFIKETGLHKKVEFGPSTDS
jgi:hypothetical protein